MTEWCKYASTTAFNQSPYLGLVVALCHVKHSILPLSAKTISPLSIEGVIPEGKRLLIYALGHTAYIVEEAEDTRVS